MSPFLIGLFLSAAPTPAASCVPGPMAGESARSAAALNAALDAKCPVNTPNDYGETALMLAAGLGDKALVARLIAAGAEVNGQDRSGRTAISSAAESGSVEVLRLLLARKPALETKSQTESTPLLTAAGAQKAPERLAMVKLLLDAGANGDALDEFKRGLIARAIAHDDEALFALALERKPTLALHAAGAMDAAVGAGGGWVKRLLDLGIDPDVQRVNGGGSGLSAAAKAGQIEALRVLLTKAKQLDLADSDGRTPLILAAMAGHLEAVKLLVAAGAKLETKDWDGFTALARAETERHEDVANFLAEKLHVASLGSGIDALIWGGGPAETDAQKWLATWQAEAGRYPKLFELAPGFPKLVKSESVPGMNPGFHVVVLGYCLASESGRRLGLFKAIADRVYAKRVKLDVRDGCPSVKGATDRVSMAAIALKSGDRLQVAEVKEGDGTMVWVTLRKKTGELIEQKTVRAASDGAGGYGKCDAELVPGRDNVRLIVSCEGSYRAGCSYPASKSETVITEQDGKLNLKARSDQNGNPSKCFE